MQRPYLIRKRGKYWYYRLAGESTYHSTGLTRKGDAESYALGVSRGIPAATGRTLGELLEPAYDWDRCPHVTRLRAEGKVISRQHATNQRRLVSRLILPDELCRKAAPRVSRGDILALRTRILEDTTNPIWVSMQEKIRKGLTYA